MNKYFIYIYFLIFICSVLAVGLYFSDNAIFEGLDINQTKTILQNADSSYTVPTGYYVISTDTIKKQQTVSKIPYGYKVDSTGNLYPTTTAQQYSTSQTVGDPNWAITSDTNSAYSKQTRYSPENNNIQYHTDPTTDTSSTSAADNLAQTGTWVIDQCGNKVLIPWSDVTTSITYYTPGSYTYGPSTYVPNYEDSVYLSKTTQMSQVSPVYNMASIASGFCEQYKNYPEQVEQYCNALDVNTCGSTSCCVLLGGTKCVAGDSSGPANKSNYSDVFIRNKDVYYYQGNCYGNCI